MFFQYLKYDFSQHHTEHQTIYLFYLTCHYYFYESQVYLDIWISNVSYFYIFVFVYRRVQLLLASTEKQG